LVLTLGEEHGLGLFENRAQRRIFGLERDEITEGWRKLHNEELNKLYSSPNIIRIIKSRRIRWAWNRVHTRFWQDLKERNHYEDLELDGRMILKWILEKLDAGCRLDSFGSG
jgi:hypothetical protein